MKSMRMNGKIQAGVLGACLLFSATALANQVTTIGGPSNLTPGRNGYGIWQTLSGGEFTLKPDAQLSWVLGQYAAVASDQGVADTFQTFCVESAERISAFTTYDVTINDRTVFAGKILTKGAAYLYDEFRKGTLAGYDYAGRTTADALQQAIWYFMAQGSNPGNSFVTAGSANGGFAHNAGYYPVAVLNLWTPGHVGEVGYAAQDLLVAVSDGGMTLMMLGWGLGTAGVFLRKRRS